MRRSRLQARVIDAAMTLRARAFVEAMNANLQVGHLVGTLEVADDGVMNDCSRAFTHAGNAWRMQRRIVENPNIGIEGEVVTRLCDPTRAIGGASLIETLQERLRRTLGAGGDPEQLHSARACWLAWCIAARASADLAFAINWIRADMAIDGIGELRAGPGGGVPDPGWWIAPVIRTVFNGGGIQSADGPFGRLPAWQESWPMLPVIQDDLRGLRHDVHNDAERQALGELLELMHCPLGPVGQAVSTKRLCKSPPIWRAACVVWPVAPYMHPPLWPGRAAASLVRWMQRSIGVEALLAHHVLNPEARRGAVGAIAGTVGVFVMTALLGIAINLGIIALAGPPGTEAANAERFEAAARSWGWILAVWALALSLPSFGRTVVFPIRKRDWEGGVAGVSSQNAGRLLSMLCSLDRERRAQRPRRLAVALGLENSGKTTILRERGANGPHLNSQAVEGHEFQVGAVRWLAVALQGEDASQWWNRRIELRVLVRALLAEASVVLAVQDARRNQQPFHLYGTMPFRPAVLGLDNGPAVLVVMNRAPGAPMNPVRHAPLANVNDQAIVLDGPAMDHIVAQLGLNGGLAAMLVAGIGQLDPVSLVHYPVEVGAVFVPDYPAGQIPAGTLDNSWTDLSGNNAPNPRGQSPAAATFATLRIRWIVSVALSLVMLVAWWVIGSHAPEAARDPRVRSESAIGSTEPMDPSTGREE